MPNQKVQEQVEKGELILAVDLTRALDDPHKLTPLLLALVTARLADLRLKDQATYSTEASRASASVKVRAALDELQALHGEGYNFINGLLRSVISAPDRLGLFVSYGWESGNIGDFTDARIEALANQAIAVTPTIVNAAHRYPAALLNQIVAQLAILNTNQVLATGGTQLATDARNAALADMDAITERVRHSYCAASDLRAKNPELARIGFQVQRDAGDAQPQQEPGPAGPIVYNAADQTVTVPTLPDGATRIRAYRQVLGGAPEPAGISETTTVSVTQLAGPLTPGATYQFWLVGVNSAGEGPESIHLTHSVSVGPGGP